VPPTHHSSGDLIADRRYEYARAYAEAGDAEAAADLYRQTLDLAPDFLPALIGAGDALIALGRPAEAAPLLRRAERLDPDGLFGAPLRLALAGATAVPAHPPQAYIRGLFDDYAGRFEQALVETLHYRAPTLIAQALDAACPGRTYRRGIDLGCGTGLMAQALAGRVGHFTGCDLAPAMIAEARAAGRYQALDLGDAAGCLAAAPAGFDLVTAADVFVYVGRLEAMFAAVAARLAAGGAFAFSVEETVEGEVILRDSLRYAHGESYLRRTAADAGLAVVTLTRAVLRQDRDQPIHGLICVASR